MLVMDRLQQVPKNGLGCDWSVSVKYVFNQPEIHFHLQFSSVVRACHELLGRIKIGSDPAQIKENRHQRPRMNQQQC
jgi:hypothetical protein